MQKNILNIVLIGVFCSLLLSFQSCKTGEGCGYEDKYKVKVDKNGQISGQKGSSNLFSPKQRKKMRN